MWGVLFRAERKLEELRLRLKQRPYFNLEQAFLNCSRTKSGVILGGDLRDILAEQGFYSTEREL